MMKTELEILRQLENKFHARYMSVSQLKGQENSAKWLKRSWLDVKREIRNLEKPTNMKIYPKFANIAQPGAAFIQEYAMEAKK